MNRLINRTLMATVAFCAISGALHAQREVFSPEELTDYQKRLPAAMEATGVTALKAHLKAYQGSPKNRALANAVRVAGDASAGSTEPGATFGYYSVPAISPVMRLPDAYPIDGRFGGEVGIVLAQDEYEPGSFVLYPFTNQGKVELTVSDLKGSDGSTFSKDNLDLKVVKVWYQNGNGWFSYFQDVGLELVPELLLKDENLIRVDSKNKANYARIKAPGKKGEHEVWISPPRKLETGFNPWQKGFADAKTLQPVELVAGEFKQFILTAHADAKAKPGLYRGKIAVSSAGKALGDIPVAVRILPFALPFPKSYHDPDKEMVVSLMGGWRGFRLDPEIARPTFENMRRHNILHMGPGIRQGDSPEQEEAQVSLMKEAGFKTDFIFSGNLTWVGTHGGEPLTFDDLMKVKRSASKWRDFHLKYFGHTHAALIRGDEQGAAWIMKGRPAWRIIHQLGMLTYIAGHQEAYFSKGGFMLNVRPIAGYPGQAEKPRQWNEIKNGYTGFYAGQHNGSENPSFVRRQHGLEGYLAGFDMIDNYEFAYGPWNDLATELYKPMVVAYPTSEGLVDTLAWEGFREGVDDIRYATKLRELAAEAIASGQLDRVYEGRKIYQWFAMLDGSGIDLNATRMEMIEKIQHLLSLSGAKN